MKKQNLTVTTCQFNTRRKAADVLVIPFWFGKKSALEAMPLPKPIKEDLNTALKTGDFKGKKQETLIVYSSQNKEKRLLLIGLDKEKDLSQENLRRAYAKVCLLCCKKKWQRLTLFLPQTKVLNLQELAYACAEGLSLANYSFEDLKQENTDDDSFAYLRSVCFVNASSSQIKSMKEVLAISRGVDLARDLVNGNADDVTPEYLGLLAQKLAKKYPQMQATVFNKKRIEKEKMGLLLAVNRGSFREPRFIILKYRGKPSSKDHTVIIGKGVTYDSGGLNLKPTGFLETMKSDMGGAAAVFGMMVAAAETKLKKNITLVVPSTENSMDALSYKPGDVYSSYDQRSVEIANTDAEGRLILADALAYSEKNLKPEKMISLCTLTGAMVVALGHEVSGYMCNDDQLAQELFEAGEQSYDRVWRFPLYKEYEKQLESTIADIKNCGTRAAGSITAALFLKKFVKDTPWANIDIAGTAFLDEKKHYRPKGGTGFGVRLLYQLFKK